MNSLVVISALIVGYFMISDKSFETQVKKLEPIHYIGILIVAVFLCNMEKKEGYCKLEATGNIDSSIPDYNLCESPNIWVDSVGCAESLADSLNVSGELLDDTLNATLAACCSDGTASNCWTEGPEHASSSVPWSLPGTTYEKCCTYPGDTSADAGARLARRRERRAAATGLCSGNTHSVDDYACPDGSSPRTNANTLLQEGGVVSEEICCEVNADCAGTWSDCTANCDRIWTETAAQRGQGTPCPVSPDCAPGDGDCPDGDLGATSGSCECPPATSDCKVAGTCQESDGQCTAETNAPDGTACDDGNPDTDSDVCTGGVCGGGPLAGIADCVPPNDLNDLEGYSDVTGILTPGENFAGSVACAQGYESIGQGPTVIPCLTSGGEYRLSGCQVVDAAAGTAGNAGSVSCANVTCPEATSACKVAGICQESDGQCSAETNAADGTGCDDGDAGTIDDVCTAGVCAGTADVDCYGTWSDCTAECEEANERNWNLVTAKSGQGADCPTASDCGPGDGTCTSGPVVFTNPLGVGDPIPDLDRPAMIAIGVDPDNFTFKYDHGLFPSFDYEIIFTNTRRGTFKVIDDEGIEHEKWREYLMTGDDRFVFLRNAEDADGNEGKRKIISMERTD